MGKSIRSQFVLAKRSVNSRLFYYIPQYNRFDLQQLIFIMVISIMTRRFRWILGGIIWDNTKISPLVSFRKSTYPKYMRKIYIQRNRAYKYMISPNDHGHLQQIHLQRPGLCGPPQFKPFPAKPLAAGHLQRVTCSKIGHFQQKQETCSDHLQSPFVVKLCIF